MNSMLRTLLAGGFIAVATAAASGCADNNSTLFIRGVLDPKAPECVVSNDPNAFYLGSGTLDVAFGTSYHAWLLVGNQYASRGSKVTSRTETARVSLTGAEINLTDSQGASLQKFSVYGSGFADVSKGEEPGYGIFFADLIPEGVGQSLRDQINGNRQVTTQVIANVKVFGSSLGNKEVESAELSFPIEVCYGCLIQYPLNAIDYSTTRPTCREGTSSTDSQKICSVGQDDYISCDLCAVALKVCSEVPLVQ